MEIIHNAEIQIFFQERSKGLSCLRLFPFLILTVKKAMWRTGEDNKEFSWLMR